MSRKPLPWSHTALSDFLNCPHQYYRKRVLKDVEDPPGEAATWGDTVHKGFEVYLNGGTLAENLKAYQGYLDDLLSYQCDRRLVEQQYALNSRMQPCDWFAPDVWCRGILDFLLLKGNKAMVLDHKTGKRKPNPQQLKLFALLVFAHHPEVDQVLTGYHWLREGESDTSVFHRSQEAELWEEFMGPLTRYKFAFQNDIWNPRPSGLCRGWCPVRDCEHWKPKPGVEESNV